MGVFTLLMVISSIFYSDGNQDTLVKAAYFVIIVGVYFLPLICHMKTLKVADFVKGIVYIIFMSPTYVNIMSVYAVSNIHDVSWGSRPVGTEENSGSNREKRMSEDYQNYRSKFLVIWILLNNLAGYYVVVLSRNESDLILPILAFFLMGLIVFKMIFSLFHI